MNHTYSGANHYYMHLDMKLDFTIRTFQELKTLHQLCELERIQNLQSLALALLKSLLHFQKLLKKPLIMNAKSFGTTQAPKKYRFHMFLPTHAASAII